MMLHESFRVAPAREVIPFERDAVLSVRRCRSLARVQQFVCGFGIFAAMITSMAVGQADPMRFSRDIQPVLAEYCYPCHGPDENTRKAKLRLDTHEGAISIREGRAAVVPGKPEESHLLLRIMSNDPDEVMPPSKHNRKLPPAERDRLRQWILEGASWGEHWAFVSPERESTPRVAVESSHLRNPIDAFVLRRLARERIPPSAEAPRETLIRRVTLDLTGIPPTLEEVDAFVLDPRPDAYERVVDRLLASPRYGERMAWEWLDAARYADSNGYQGDPSRTQWLWRDQLISVLNENQPFDQFTIEQLAGDLLPNPTRRQIIATGFQRNHMINGEGGRIEEESRVDYVVDRTDTLSTVWLGLTLGCARCHDHKFDPFSQKEYYQLYSFFNNVPETGGTDAWPNAKPLLALTTPEQESRLKALEADIKNLQQQYSQAELVGSNRWVTWRDAETEVPSSIPTNLVALLKLPVADLSEPQRKQLTEFAVTNSEPGLGLRRSLDDSRKALKALNDSIEKVMVMAERETTRDSFLLVRGAYDRPGAKVEPDFPTAISGEKGSSTEGTRQRLTRLDLARWLVSQSNPLTARVMVNRAWQTFFGTGIVKTSEDFGIQGEKPADQELLDWLAVDFRENDWDIKRLHRQMVTSATYRQASGVSPELLERDPENRLLARGARYRLPSWMIRDQALAIAGLLTDRMGGRPVKPYQPPGIWEEATFGQIKYEPDHGEALYRRSLYVFWRRIVGPTMFFDVSSRQTCSVRQGRTSSPLHALLTLNDVTYMESARVLAERVLAKQGMTDDGRIQELHRRCTSRIPNARELLILRSSLSKLRAHYQNSPTAAAELVAMGEFRTNVGNDPAELAAWTGLGSLVLNLDESLTKE